MHLILEYPYLSFALFVGAFAAIVLFRFRREKRRQAARASLAPGLGLTLLGEADFDRVRDAYGYNAGHIHYLLGASETLLFERGEATSRDAPYRPSTYAAFRCGGIGPRFVLEPGGKDVPGCVPVPGLTDGYHLSTEDTKARDLFGASLVRHLRENPGWCLAHRGNGWLLAYRDGAITPDGLEAFLDEARALKTLLLEKAGGTAC